MSREIALFAEGILDSGVEDILIDDDNEADNVFVIEEIRSAVESTLTKDVKEADEASPVPEIMPVFIVEEIWLVLVLDQLMPVFIVEEMMPVIEGVLIRDFEEADRAFIVGLTAVVGVRPYDWFVTSGTPDIDV